MRREQVVARWIGVSFHQCDFQRCCSIDGVESEVGRLNWSSVPLELVVQATSEREISCQPDATTGTSESYRATGESCSARIRK